MTAGSAHRSRLGAAVAVGLTVVAALIVAPGTAGAAPTDPDLCSWYEAATELAGSIADAQDPRADAIRERLDRLGITEDSPPPPSCVETEPAPPRPGPGPADPPAPRTGEAGGALAVGSDGRTFTRGGEPFFWMGDTAWSLFVNLDREEVVDYLDTRSEQGFTVIQAVAIFPQAGGPGPNRYGDSPFGGGLDDISVTAGAEAAGEQAYDFWDHVDFVLDEADERGMVIGILPVWADTQAGSLVTTGNAGGYGEFLGERFGDRDNVVWIMGGDSPADGVEDIWRELATGIRSAGGEQLATYHPRGDQTSVTWFGDDEWIDFHMLQGGHCLRYDVRVDLLRTTYDAGKPFLDGEPIYEDHPYCWDNPPDGFSTAVDVRRDAYWAVLGGAAGHTYGHHAVWQFLEEGSSASLGARGSWTDGIDFPAANQMRHVRALIESRPRVEPAEVVSDPGSGAGRIAAAADPDGSTVMAYTGDGGAIDLDLSGLSGDTAQPWWFDPRTGETTRLDPVDTAGTSSFSPPDGGDGGDWVLVVDDVDAGYGAPGGELGSADRAPERQPPDRPAPDQQVPDRQVPDRSEPDPDADGNSGTDEPPAGDPPPDDDPPAGLPRQDAGRSDPPGTAADPVNRETEETAPSGALLWSADFETGDLSQLDETPWNQVGSPDPEIVSDPEFVREGTNALSVTIPGGAERNEVVPPDLAFAEGDDLWFAFSSRLGDGFPVDEGWQLITQCKNDGTGAPPLELSIDNGAYSISGGYGHPDGPQTWDQPIGPAVTGEWVDWVVRIRFSADPSEGTVDVWQNGDQIVSGHTPRGGTRYPDLDSYLSSSATTATLPSTGTARCTSTTGRSGRPRRRSAPWTPAV